LDQRNIAKALIEGRIGTGESAPLQEFSEKSGIAFARRSIAFWMHTQFSVTTGNSIALA
jgi:hypothetical protein